MRYFLEVQYKGTHYRGFQVQQNARTIQGEIERALHILFQQQFMLTGSSRTDSGVHARQNYFHFDTETELRPACIYNLNAILPEDIVIKTLRAVAPDAHCRFDASSRRYVYTVYAFKNAFMKDTGYFYPYPLDLELMNEAAALLFRYTDYEAFSKKNTQVYTYQCTISHSQWHSEAGILYYTVEANRFLRGMVRALVATMLRVGRGTLSLADFEDTLQKKKIAYFDSPAHGLLLHSVNY